MKFLVCLVLCFAAAAQAGLVGVQNAVAYSSPYTTYSAGLAPALYNAPLAYTAYPSVYSAGYTAPTVYNTAGVNVASPLVASGYAAPSVYSAPIVSSTFLKK
ncbi:uncharacterized protein LOC129910270 [Episyrphus balteatus]|uniref:uncharacterized protein LOC129910270 n=1 Tax=Episyrphus balteatus TaxID=286459 RepID=UPI0024854EAC|nr:uncharacterized protein LOC129910270 [Episyrphus balteatus]